MAPNFGVVNGRLHNDKNIGRIMCFTHNVQRLFDYLLTRSENFENIVHFEIRDFNEFSNHAPIEYNLKTGTTSKKYTRGPKTFVKWNSIYREAFISELSSDIVNLESSLIRWIENNDDTEDIVSMFTQYLTSKGNPYFARTINSDANQFDAHDKNKQK